VRAARSPPTRDIDPATEKRKLFVGNLPWSLSEQDISDAFGEYGTIEEVKIVLDRETGRSRGFGFVTYEESSAAEEAVENLNGVELAGREIRVSMSQPMSERPRREGFGGGGRGRGGGGYGGGRGGGYGGGGGGGYGGGVRGGGGGGYDNGY